jgi:hypothetical protein
MNESDKETYMAEETFVIQRSGEIPEVTLQDLDPGNRDKKIYRGLARCTVNWHRLFKFCFTEKIDSAELEREIAAALQNFLLQEVTDVLSGMRASSINCASQDIEKMAASLGLSLDDLPEGWQDLRTSA